MKNLKKDDLKKFAQKVEDGTNETIDIKDSLMDEDGVTSGPINYNDIVKNSPEAIMSKVPWIVSIVLIILVTVSFCALFFQRNPRTIFMQAVDGFFENLDKPFNNNAYDLTQGKLSLEYKYQNNLSDNKLGDELSKIKWTASYQIDRSNNMAFAKINAKYDNTSNFGIDIYNDGNTKYVKTDNMDKYIKTDNGHFSLNLLNNLGGGNVIITALNQAFDKSIASEKINGKNTYIDIDGQRTKVYESKLVIDKKNKDRVFDIFINTLTSDRNLIKVVRNYKDMDLNQANLFAKVTKDNVLKLLDEMGDITITVYTEDDLNKLVRFEINSDLGKLTVNCDDGYSYLFEKDSKVISGNLKITGKNDKYNIEFIYDEKNDGNSVTYQKVNLNVTNRSSDLFKRPNISDNIEYSKLTDLEKFDLQTKISMNPVIDKLIQNGFNLNLDEWFK